ncbi:hypothetical protein L486_07715 [Kwoniella mangroviensis CBS 10435]|uniref:Uncharacterized protein n=1 Tax=Kwoniella mangroviensis CBS 10435 TaxID=1331196 RepID=A0A1B9IG99_9TREE|nr:hypothetical protein L486_07715 [Kwoniella mangroviensis CBS 10435]
MNVSNFVVHQDHPSTDSDESTLSQLLTGLPLYAFQQKYDEEDFPRPRSSTLPMKRPADTISQGDADEEELTATMSKKRR